MDNYFGKNIVFLRTKKGLNQTELAEKLNVPRSTLCCWEAGIRTPKISEINKIAVFFNVGMDITTKFYDDSCLNKEYQEITAKQFKNELLDRLKQVNNLSEDEKNMIKQQIEFICK